MTPAALISEARHSCRLTLEQVAKACRVHLMTVWRWEHGVSAVPADKILKLAATLKIDPMDLLRGRKP